MNDNATRNKENILLEKDRGRHKARDTLSGLFRDILYEHDIGPVKWERKMMDFMSNARAMLAFRGKSKNSIRGNLRKALLSNRMTWLMFERGLYFLGVKRARYSIELEWPNGKKTINTREIDLQSVTITSADLDNVQDDDEDDVMGMLLEDGSGEPDPSNIFLADFDSLYGPKDR